MDNLPCSKSGKSIKWSECVGQTIRFEYDEIEGNFRILEYKTDGKNAQVNILYNNNNKWIHTKQLTSGEIGLLIGAKKVVKKTGYKKYEIGDAIKNGINDLIITNYEIRKGYQFICNICGYDCSEYYKNGKYYKSYWMDLHRKKYNFKMCPCCANTIVVPGKNDLATLTPETIKYFPGDSYEEKKKNASRYSPHSNQRTNIICPDCGKLHKNILINNIQKGHFGCECSDGISYPEKFMIDMLNQIGIEYKYQAIFEWCKYYNPYKNKMTFGRYDFYIPCLRLIIEMDGGYGHGNKEDTYEEDVYIDNMKDKLAKQQGIKVIRIDSIISCKEYLSDSIKSKLSTYFKIDNIDFDSCNNYAKSNLRHKVIEEYIRKETYAQNLSGKYGVSVTTVIRWISQDGIEYKPNNRHWLGKHNIKNSKPVIINGKRYDSAHICEENSLNDFGFLIKAESLQNAIRAGRKYKGMEVAYAQNKFFMTKDFDEGINMSYKKCKSNPNCSNCKDCMKDVPYDFCYRDECSEYEFCKGCNYRYNIVEKG